MRTGEGVKTVSFASLHGSLMRKWEGHPSKTFHMWTAANSLNQRQRQLIKEGKSYLQSWVVIFMGAFYTKSVYFEWHDNLSTPPAHLLSVCLFLSSKHPQILSINISLFFWHSWEILKDSVFGCCDFVHSKET